MIEILDGPGRSVHWPPEDREWKRGWTIAELNTLPEVVVVRVADLRKVELVALNAPALVRDAHRSVRDRILAAAALPGELLIGEGGFGRLPDATRLVCAEHADDEDEVVTCSEGECSNVATHETWIPLERGSAPAMHMEGHVSPPAGSIPVPAVGREVRFMPPADMLVMPAEDLVARMVEVQARMTALDLELRIMRRDANRAHMGGDRARMGGVDHVVRHIQAVLDGDPLFHMDAGLRRAGTASGEES